MYIEEMELERENYKEKKEERKEKQKEKKGKGKRNGKKEKEIGKSTWVCSSKEREKMLCRNFLPALE